MAPEIKVSWTWRDITIVISIVIMIFGLGVTWQKSQSATDSLDKRVSDLKQSDQIQWKKLRKIDEVGMNLKALMESQGIRYVEMGE